MNEELQLLALKIDSATDESDIPALMSLVEECTVRTQHGDDLNEPTCFFLLANCHSALAALEAQAQDDEWSWKQDHKVSEILNLRKAASSQTFPELDVLIQCKIFTNTAGALSYLGRPAEAIATWDEALVRIPNFAMALGNKGVGVLSYGNCLYDHGHTAVLASYASANLEAAISEGALWDSGPDPEFKQYFNAYCRESIEYLNEIGYDSDFDLNQWSLGETDEEIEYRTWCLSKRLFLSPLNDICMLSTAAQDVLHLPDHCYKIDEIPRFVGYYNSLKQEYATARHLLFDGLTYEDSHYADNDVLLLHAGDGAQHGYRYEQMKIAYRLLYSLLDKIAIFINEYFSIGLAANAVSFRKIWGKTKKGGLFELYDQFKGSKNWPLRGLFYLSKDLFDEDFNDTALPESRDLAKLRNCAEHRFVSLGYGSTMNNYDEVHTYVNVDSFEKKAIRVARIVRESLIYLSLAMHREEAQRQQASTDLTVSVQSIPIEK